MTSDPVEGEDGNSGDGNDDAKEHNRDETSGSICCFWGGLGDTKGVDEHVREIKERLHGFEKGCIFIARVASIAKVRFLRANECTCRCTGRRLH